ncbi:MAG TPA: hypothetical protein VMB04_27040 [Mycobacterium sp.]|nr:hypothetical protein [Mycobacterium sp.]
MSTVFEQPTRRAHTPTDRGRRTQATIDAAARTVVARKGILATTVADIAAEWAEICANPTSFITETVRRAKSEGYCAGDDPHLIAVPIVAMFNQFCCLRLAGPGPRLTVPPDDQTCIDTLANIFYRAIYYEEVRPR